MRQPLDEKGAYQMKSTSEKRRLNSESKKNGFVHPDQLDCLARASIIRNEIRLTSYVFTAIIQGNPIANDIKKILLRLNSQVTSLIVLKTTCGKSIDFVWLDEDVRHELVRVQRQIKMALSLPVVKSRPTLIRQCEDLASHFTHILADDLDPTN